MAHPQPREKLLEMSAHSHSPESKEKRRATYAARRAIKAELYKEIRESLASPDKRGKVFYSSFLKAFLESARKKPEGRAAQTVAKIMLQEDIIDKLDAETERAMSRDTDFMRYRIDGQLFDRQKDVMRDRISRRKVLLTSRRAGKTEFCARKIVDAAAKPDTPIFYVGLTGGNAVKQTFDIVANVAEQVGLPIVSKTKKDGDAHIRFSNGSIVYFRGNHNRDDIEKFRGFKSRLVIIDEAQSQKNLEYLVDDVISPLLVDFEDSELVLCGTPPRAPRSYFERCYKNAHWKSYSWDMRQNPFIPNAENEILSICNQKGVSIEASLIQREYLGQIVYDAEAQVFKGYQTFVKRPEMKVTNVYIGNDYGWAAYNAIIGIACDAPNKKAYVFFERKFNKAKVSDIIAANEEALKEGRALLMASGADIGAIGIYGDTSDNSIIYEMSQTYGLPAYRCYKYDRDAAIAQLAEETRTGRLLVQEDGILASEFDQTLYARDEGDNLMSGLDDTYHPDAVFALLYASRQMFFDEGLRDDGNMKEE